MIKQHKKEKMSNSEFYAKFYDAMVHGEELNRDAKAKYEEDQRKIEEDKKARLKIAQKEVVDKYTPIIREKLLYAASHGYYNTFFRLDRSDFRGWHKFVEGGYCDAHPVHLALSMLSHMHRNDIIPGCIDYEFLNEQKFIVEFSWGQVKK